MSRPNWPGSPAFPNGAAPARRRGAPTSSAAPWPGGGPFWPCTARPSWPGSRCWSPTSPASSPRRAHRARPAARVPAAVTCSPQTWTGPGSWPGSPRAQLAGALAEAIHAGTPGGDDPRRPGRRRARVEQLAAALGGDLTPARLAAAVQVALGQPVPPGLLTDGRGRPDQRGPVPRRLPRPDRHQPGPPRRVPLRPGPLRRDRAAAAGPARPGARAWRSSPARAAPAPSCSPPGHPVAHRRASPAAPPPPRL